MKLTKKTDKMFWSKNNTFFKPKFALENLREDMVQLLTLKGRSVHKIKQYEYAFFYFMQNPEKFDGATIVKDLNDLPNLDLDAMLHDFEYLTGANKSFVKKWKSDFKYLRNMEKNGKGIRVFRFIILTLIGFFFVPYCCLKNLKKSI